MVIYVQLITTILLLSGCSINTNSLSKDDYKIKDVSGAEMIKDFQSTQEKQNGDIPQIMLPSVYQEPSIFSEEKITFSAENTSLSKLLYLLSQTSGLNLVIDNDIDTNIPITMSVQDALIEEVLEIIMNISGNYYVLQGNMLHVKQFIRKNFDIPYVHSTTSFDSELGGDTLNSTQGIKGNFKLKFNNPEKSNNFYEEIENNIKSILSKDGNYALNAFTGTLTVYDKKHNVDAIEKMINSIKRKSSQQVVIQARILEVILNNGHSLGVDWSALGKSILTSGDTLAMSQTLGLSGATAGVATYNHNNFSAIISALDSAGNIDTLSNPRIKVLSGQSALITSGKLIPYWEKNLLITPATSGSPETRTITYDRRDILDGITMGVTPSIMKNGNIMLNIIPVSSSIESNAIYVDEDGVTVATAPVINIKEAGTTIYAKDNDLVMIGGLISNVKNKKVESVPLLGDIPYLGALFSRTVYTEEKRELIILLKLNIEEQ
ncbi:type II secretion system protein GspD [Candidatus Sulfurimonas baltica]|uniref:Type II/III secretion system secretin-like domain-containing protein n=1 Tax=Candidatus Sulfurimonas baltica TaxID=2740404 RepID=A0A7S7LX90_9BACT|nr:hypothetical protein [Candidatus Sulfurimonas baltica]QOY53060.1 hypothetical protein HUE88_05110 [Candidatus Sulfurimonas baltica]